PDTVVAAVKQLVLTEPEQQLGNDMSKIARARMNERQRDGKPAIDVGFLGSDPAEIVQPRQTAVFDNEVQILEGCRDIIDIGNIEGVPVQGQNRRPLMNVDVLDSELLGFFQKAVGRGISQLVAFGVSLPLGGI